MDNEKELINKILELDDNNQAYNLSSDSQAETFFAIIGRSKDEDLISRMLAYVLKKDMSLFGKLLEFYFNEQDNGLQSDYDYSSCKVTNINCEKVMSNGRADIFVQGEDESDNKFTLTIENKVDSFEHDEQTQTYYDYVSSHMYKTHNAYLFLKPDYNYSPISCDRFKPLSYSQLWNKIDESSQDIFIQDFRRHIEKWFNNTEVKFMEIDTFILQNYSRLKQIINETDRKYESFKQWLFQEICKDNKIPGLNVDYNVNSRKDNKKKYTSEENENDTLCVWTESDKIQIFRDKWYFKSEEPNNGYYFYVEMMFKNDDPNEIIYQKVGRDYSNKSIIRKFSADSKFNYINDINDKWTVFTDSSEHEKFNSGNYELLSDGWKTKLIEFSIQKLSNYIKEMDGIFERFREWKKANLG